MEKIIDRTIMLYRGLCSAILAIMVLIVFFNALTRYLFHSGFIATEELLRYLFIYLSFLGIVEVAYYRKHISITLLTDVLPQKIRTSVYIFGYLLSILALIILTDGSIEYFKESDTSVGQVTGIPFQIIIISIIFASISLIFIFLRDLVLALKALFITNTPFPPKFVDEDLKEILEKNNNVNEEGAK